MTNKIHMLAIFAIAGTLIGSISVGSSVFATGNNNWDDDHDDWNKDYDGKKSWNYGKHDSSNNGVQLYVNSLTFDVHDLNAHDSCDIQAPPCVKIDPFRFVNDEGESEPMLEEIFIADPELTTTKTLITLNVYREDAFPTKDDVNEFGDLAIFQIPECFTIGPGNFDGVNGIFMDCQGLDLQEEPGLVFDVTYAFSQSATDSNDNDDHDDDHDDDSWKSYKNYWHDDDDDDHDDDHDDDD